MGFCLVVMCTTVFLFKTFQPLMVTYLPTIVLKTLILLSWRIFTFQSGWIITHILAAFSITFLAQFVKKRSSTPWSFLRLSFNVFFTFDQLFTCRSDVFNNLAISLTKWPQYHKNRCLSCSTNSVCFHFHERGEKTEDHGKNTKIETYKMGRKNMAGEKLAYMKKILYFLQISVWNCFERLFRKILYLCLKKH